MDALVLLSQPYAPAQRILARWNLTDRTKETARGAALAAWLAAWLEAWLWAGLVTWLWAWLGAGLELGTGLGLGAGLGARLLRQRQPRSRGSLPPRFVTPESHAPQIGARVAHAPIRVWL